MYKIKGIKIFKILNEEAPVYKIKGIKNFESFLELLMDLLSCVVVHLISKSGFDEGFKKDQIKINTFFTKKLFKTYIPSRIFM